MVSPDDNTLRASKRVEAERAKERARERRGGGGEGSTRSSASWRFARAMVINVRSSVIALKDAPLRGSVIRRGVNHGRISARSFSFCRLCVWANERTNERTAARSERQRTLSLLSFNDSKVFFHLLLFSVLPALRLFRLFRTFPPSPRFNAQVAHPPSRFRRILRPTALYLCSI